MRLNVFLLAVFVASVAINLAIRPHPARPNTEYLPEMVHSVAYDSFSPNPNFPDGKTLQAPVAGAIPRGTRAIWMSDAAARGAFVFQTFCQPCHGASGRGDGPVVLRGYPAPASLLAEKAINLTDREIFHLLTYGRKNMPSYASQLSPGDRWDVILHVRSMQRSVQP